MLDLYSISEEFENGLNRQLNDPSIKFHIWVDAGERTKPQREGNGVLYFIDGILHPTASENLGTIIDMGAWQLTLMLAVPIPPPRTAADPAASLNRIDEEQYAFLAKIADAINTYFSIAESITVMPQSGKSYSVGIRAGVAIPDLVDLRYTIGESIVYTVYVSLGYVEGGVNSREGSLALDKPESLLPVMNAQLTRSNVLSLGVYAGNTRRQSVASASALAIAAEMPLTGGTGQIYDFLVDGEINVAHFVFYTLEGKETVYWMTVDEPVQAYKEVQNIGQTVHFIEIVDDDELVGVPASYQVALLIFEETGSEKQVTIDTDTNVYAHIGNENYRLEAGKSITVDLDGQDLSFSEPDRKYYVRIVTNGAAALTVRYGDVTRELPVVKEAKDG